MRQAAAACGIRQPLLRSRRAPRHIKRIARASRYTSYSPCWAALHVALDTFLREEDSKRLVTPSAPPQLSARDSP